jgi:hypothetical protein
VTRNDDDDDDDDDNQRWEKLNLDTFAGDQYS